MDDEQRRALDYLARLAEQPAVAFHEGGVASAVGSILEELGLGFQEDVYGNIIVRVPGRQTDCAPLALVAHMDHPGFEAIATHEGYLVCDALGGVPAASFEAEVPLHVVLADGRRLRAATAGRHGEKDRRQTLARLAEPRPLELPRPVVFDLPDFQVDGELIHMRAADDLAGCGAILATLAALTGNPPPGDVFGVFTRAEEVGLIGARLLAECGTLPQDTLIVSVESSRTLPGAEIGGGPVIRVGDTGLTFNADAEASLRRALETLQEGPDGFKAQRQLMSGGVCEASAFARHGYRTTGLAFPLGNYHNGAPEGRIGAEYIHIADYVAGTRLMVEAAHRVPEREDTGFQRRLRQVPDGFRDRLMATRLGHGRPEAQ
jgi:endoglucanase